MESVITVIIYFAQILFATFGIVQLLEGAVIAALICVLLTFFIGAFQDTPTD